MTNTRTATVLRWGLALAGAVIISPVIFLAVKGLIGLGLALLVGGALIRFAPVAETWMANWQLKAIKAAAEANPIETMQNDLAQRTDELRAKDRDIAEFETEVSNFDDQLQSFKDQYPAEAPRYQQLSDKMHQALTAMKQSQQAASDSLDLLRGNIRKAEAIYKMALAAQKVTALSKTAQSQVFSDIKQQVSFDTVRTQLNRSFANLDVAVRQRETTTLLPGQVMAGKLEPAPALVSVQRVQS